MGLFNKLKNALFEDEIEVPIEKSEEKPVTTVVEEKKDLSTLNEKKETKNTNVFLEENERELFKSENTFKFPEFDEEEFQTSYKPVEIEEKKESFVTPKERFDRVKPVSYDYDKKTKPLMHKEMKEEQKEEDSSKKTFRPSPVISPVYGVLDKNYKKEDIVTVKKEEPKPKKKFDIDAIRKKAFGTLEDDIERTFDSPKEEFYEEKKVDSLLNKSADEKNAIASEKENPSKVKEEKMSDTIEIPVTKERPEKRSEKHYKDYKMEKNEENDLKEDKGLEDTLENDLFDLIDSMYDNREEDE